jgi:hypothetical protein
MIPVNMAAKYSKEARERVLAIVVPAVVIRQYD